MQSSLITDSSDISHYAGHAWESDKDRSVEAWGARVEAFDSRVYPIICDQPKKRILRRRIIKSVRIAEATFDSLRIRRAYNTWFRFLNVCLIRINAYMEVPHSNIAKKPRKFSDISGKILGDNK